MFVKPATTLTTSMRCTGLHSGGCANTVPFRVYKKSIEASSGLRIDCDVEKVLSVLGTILPPNAQVTRSAAELTVYSLCESCWSKMDSVWGAGSYLTAAAKATDGGLYMNTTMPDYKVTGGTALNMRKIKCTVVHEMIHWSVAGTTQGFQNMVETKGMRGSDWDECMTDYLAMTTYKRLNWGVYETGYYKLPTFIDVGIALLKTASKPAFNRIQPTLSKCFPEAGLQLNPPDIKAEVEKVRVPLFSRLALRYVKGNDIKLSDTEPTTLNQFLMDIFCVGSIAMKLDGGSGGKYGYAEY